MNLQEIRNLIIKKSTVNKQFYPDIDANFDINREYKKLYNIASLSGLGIKKNTEEINIVKGTANYDRSIETELPIKVEFKKENTNNFYCLDITKDCEDLECGNSSLELTYTFNNEEIILSNSNFVGTLKLTYPKQELTELINDTDTPDSFLKDWEDLLWLKPTMELVSIYKPERLEFYTLEYQELLISFKKHYQVIRPVEKVSFRNNFSR